jgi:phosphoribosyl 1,2-cyclic phosphodiesterase
VKIRFCGVRGSTPAPGAEFVEVGGHTSCVAVTPPGSDRPRLVLDAGTGIRAVTPMLRGAPFEGTILLSHLHWDHVQGLPFFGAGDRDDAVVRLLLPSDGAPAADVLARAMSPPHFPIGPEGLRGAWTFDAVEAGTWWIGELRVTAAEVPHKGGPTFGYRLDDPQGSFAYVPDHLPAAAGEPRRAVLDLVAGVDVLVHDAQFLPEERARAEDYGHATVDQAVALATDAGVGRLVLFHHAPDRTDRDVAAIRRGLGPRSDRVTVAVEGDSIEVGRAPAAGRA